jgi:3',5'-nucleoside bisphosphate phosphatase
MSRIVRVELHCHSTHSDGSHAATEVARMAARAGVELFCLTDHDTWAGYEETRGVLEGDGVTVLRGMELSCREFNRTVHVLLYGICDGPGREALERRLERVHDDRRSRIARICARLHELGVHIDTDAVLAGAEGRIPGRPDVARALVMAGVCNSPRDAFNRFLRDGGPADVPIERLSVAEGVALGRAAGARMSLAHPHTLGGFHLVRALFVRLKAQGLEGIEAYYGKYAAAETIAWLRLANELELVATGGSDFHGDMSPGVSRPVIELPPARAAALREWLAA